MSSIPTTPPSGFRDFLPDSCVLRSRVIETISRVYRSFGFSPIATSAVEDLAVLTGKGGGENEKLIFKILKRGEKLEAAQGTGELADLGLRFDLTLPLARYFSRHRGILPTPFKAFHIGPVWRAERAQKGRYREFYQCDVDIIGSDNPHCEVEVISAVLAVFKELGLARPTVLLNDRTLLYSILDSAGIPAEKRVAVCVLLDKLDKETPEAVYGQIALAADERAAQILKSIMAAGSPAAGLTSPESAAVLARLERIRTSLRELHDNLVEVKIAPSLIRGFDYYTGTVFEFRDPRLAGSLGGGGRYDGLTEKFGGQKTPACGVSIGFERLMLVLEESQTAKPSGPDACLTVFSEELRLETLRLAARLRAEGLMADVFPGTAKLKAQFKYADSRGARFALVLGPDEAAAGKVKAKDLATGTETMADYAELAALLKRGWA